jgi:hypothetical protein
MTEEKQLKTLIEGSWYDSETGEYLGEDIQSFTVNDASSFEWVMELLFNAESAKSAEEAKLEALKANCERKIKRASVKVEWIRARFSAEIEQYAKTKLDGKVKFVDNAYGRVSFRSKKGGLRVVDKDTALELAKLNKWTNTNKVTESFLISEMTPEQKLKAENYPAFTIEPDSETMTITTGVK